MISAGMMERRVRSLVRAAERSQARVRPRDVSDDEFPRFLREWGGQVLSPGGAAGVAGVSRPTIWSWMERGHVRAWRGSRGDIWIHVGDLVRYALKRGYEVSRRWRDFAEVTE